MSRVFGSVNEGDIRADDIICRNITATGRATFDGEVDISSAVLTGETIIDAELAGTTTLSGGHTFAGDFRATNRLTVQTSSGRAITTLTGGASDWYLGFQGYGTDTTGYLVNGNTGPGSDFGMYFYALDGTNTTATSNILELYGKSAPFGGAGQTAVRVRENLFVDGTLNTGSTITTSGSINSTKYNDTVNPPGNAIGVCNITELGIQSGLGCSQNGTAHHTFIEQTASMTQLDIRISHATFPKTHRVHIHIATGHVATTLPLTVLMYVSDLFTTPQPAMIESGTDFAAPKDTLNYTIQILPRKNYILELTPVNIGLGLYGVTLTQTD